MITVRMPSDQHAALLEAAHKSKRSLQDYCMKRLFPNPDKRLETGEVPMGSLADKRQARKKARDAKMEQEAADQSVSGVGQEQVEGTSQAERP